MKELEILEKWGWNPDFLKSLNLSHSELQDLMKVESDFEKELTALKAEFDDPENGHKYARGEDYELCYEEIYNHYEDQLAAIHGRLVI